MIICSSASRPSNGYLLSCHTTSNPLTKAYACSEHYNVAWLECEVICSDGLGSMHISFRASNIDCYNLTSQHTIHSYIGCIFLFLPSLHMLLYYFWSDLVTRPLYNIYLTTTITVTTSIRGLPPSNIWPWKLVESDSDAIQWGTVWLVFRGPITLTGK